MPNHCSNDLRISGSKEEIARFFNTIKSEDKLIGAYLNEKIGHVKIIGIFESVED
jgi:hypothetical protein